MHSALFFLLKWCVYVYFHDSVVPSVSFRPVYTGRDTVGLLLTKTTNHIQGISLRSKTLFQALCLAGAPLHFFLQADYSNNPFYYFLFPFFVLWREKSLPHHLLKLSPCTFVSVTDMETMTKTPKTKKLPGVYPLYKELEQQDTVWDAFFVWFVFVFLRENTTGPGRRQTAVVPMTSCTLQNLFFKFFCP